MKKLLNVLIFLIFFLVGIFVFQKKDKKYVSEEIHPQTEISVKEQRIDVGMLILDSARIERIEIKNVGENPFYIYNVSTGCSCIQAEYATKAILPDSIGFIFLKLMPQDLDYYVERIAVSGNFVKSPLVFSVMGNVVK